jgi:UDP-glucose 4-epimerase
MVEGRRPLVYGDGEQTRDFIYIDDTVESIVQLAERYHDSPVIDVGSGITRSFNRVIELINHQLPKKIEPVYVEKPANYVENTEAIMKSHPYHAPQVNLNQGIERLVEHLKNDEEAL